MSDQQGPLGPPPVQRMNLDILPEGMNIIATGVIVSEKQYYDLLEGHKRDGYTHHVRCQPLDRWWEVALVAKVIEGESGMALQKGSILIFYCGTRASFEAWQKEFMEKLERRQMERASQHIN